MENGGDAAETSNSGGSGVSIPASGRWNPTKEQISLLEGLYEKGVRTPTAEQIQQITARLQTFGHIEGKNVFYWFQNHKARQRQKQKQESFAFYNRCLQKAAAASSTLFPPPPNVVCSPYYHPQSELGFYRPHYSKMLLPGGTKRRSPRPDRVGKVKTSSGAGDESAHLEYNSSTTKHNNFEQETLSLFPLEPTGNLQTRTSSSTEISTSIPSSSSETNCVEEGNFGDHHQPFFDFFSGNSCGESDH